MKAGDEAGYRGGQSWLAVRSTRADRSCPPTDRDDPTPPIIAFYRANAGLLLAATLTRTAGTIAALAKSATK
jgi:hypothetical protein